MGNVTIVRTDSPVFPWRVQSECKTLAEAAAKCERIVPVNPDSFQPMTAPEMALAAGEPATGGGMATHYVEHAPDLSPSAAVLIEHAEAADDTQVGDLKAGEANP